MTPSPVGCTVNPKICKYELALKHIITMITEKAFRGHISGLTLLDGRFDTNTINKRLQQERYNVRYMNRYINYRT